MEQDVFKKRLVAVYDFVTQLFSISFCMKTAIKEKYSKVEIIAKKSHYSMYNTFLGLKTAFVTKIIKKIKQHTHTHGRISDCPHARTLTQHYKNEKNGVEPSFLLLLDQELLYTGI